MLGSSPHVLLALLSVWPPMPGGDGEAAGTVTAYCTQTKASSVSNCTLSLSVSDTSLATGVWSVTDIPRDASQGVGSTIGIFIYRHGVGMGQSPIVVQVPFGTLCVGFHDFERSAPACAAAVLAGAQPEVCNVGPMETALACNGGALGLAVGEDVNVQFWCRDEMFSGGAFLSESNLSNALHYTLR